MSINSYVIFCVYTSFGICCLRSVLLLCRSCLIIFTRFYVSHTIQRLSRITSEMMTTVQCPVRDTCPTSTNTSWTRYTASLIHLQEVLCSETGFIYHLVFDNVFLCMYNSNWRKILFLSLCSNIYHEHSWLSCLCLLCVRWWKARLSKKMWMSSAGLLLPRRTIDQKESVFYLEKTPSGSGVCSYFSRRTDILWSLSLMRWDSCIVSFRYIFKKH